MKRSLKILIVAVIVLLTTTGCVRMNYTMSIKKDKSMDFEIILAYDKKLAQNADATSDIDMEELEELAKKGYYVGAYNDGNYEGSVITKSFKNIDKISTTSNNQLVVDLEKVLDSKENIGEFFYVKKGFFKNTYHGVFKMSSDMGNEMMNNFAPEEDNFDDDEFTTEEDEFTTDDEIFNDDEFATDDEIIDEESLQNMNDMLTSMSSMMDIKFVINVPYKALSNNASEVSNNEKTLTWNLLTLQNENIDFEFELYNWINIMICLGIFILILMIVIIIIKKQKSNKNKNNSNYISNQNQYSQPVNNEPVYDQMNNQNMFTEPTNNELINNQTIVNQPINNGLIDNQINNQNMFNQPVVNNQTPTFFTPIPEEEKKEEVVNNSFNVPYINIQPQPINQPQSNEQNLNNQFIPNQNSNSQDGLNNNQNF